MATISWPLAAGLLGGEWHWPDEAQVMLLLDGVRVRDLVLQLREWSDGRYHGDPLYAGTPFSAVQHLSPWLLSLAGPNDPVLQRFLGDGLDAEWGYLLVSSAGLQAVARHLRSLLQVRPPEGDPMLLRVADPAVMNALLPAERSVAEAPWGPIAQLIVPDSVMGQWRAGAPAEDAGHLPTLVVPADGYRLDTTELRRLQACDRRTDLRQLLRFVNEHCPGWVGESHPAARYSQLDTLTREAAPWGMTSLQHWRQLCALMAELKLSSLTAEHVPSAIHELLADRSLGDASQRLRAARHHLRAASDTPDANAQADTKTSSDTVWLDEWLSASPATPSSSGRNPQTPGAPDVDL